MGGGERASNFDSRGVWEEFVLAARRPSPCKGAGTYRLESHPMHQRNPVRGHMTEVGDLRRRA